MKRKLLVLMIVSLIMLLGCQGDGLLDGSELDMSALGENEKYVVAKTIYKDLEEGAEYVSIVYKYDEYGNKVKKINYEGENRNEYSLDKWKYDKSGNVIEHIIDARKSSAYLKPYVKYQYQYNDQGKKIKEVKKNRHDETLKEIKLEYWPNGNLKSKQTVFYFGRKEEVFYNQKGDPEKGTIITGEGVKGDIKYKIDYYDNGIKRRQEKNIVYKDKVLKSEISEFDRNGNEIKYTSEGGRVYSWFEMEYDEAGNRIKFIDKDENGEIEDYKEYTYDENGNKIKYKKVYIEKGKPKPSGYAKHKYDKNGHLILTKSINKKNELKAIRKNKFKKIIIKSRDKK